MAADSSNSEINNRRSSIVNQIVLHVASFPPVRSRWTTRRHHLHGQVYNEAIKTQRHEQRGNREAGDESCPAAFIRDAPAGERNGPADHPRGAGPRGHHHDGDLPACGDGRQWPGRGKPAGSAGMRLMDGFGFGFWKSEAMREDRPGEPWQLLE